jgi:hypothetical protein
VFHHTDIGGPENRSHSADFCHQSLWRGSHAGKMNGWQLWNCVRPSCRDGMLNPSPAVLSW